MSSKIGSAPNGENNSLAGTEKVPLTGSKWAYISTVKNYVKTITDTLYSAFNHSHADSDNGGVVNHTVLTNAGTSLHVPTYSSDSNQYLDGEGNWIQPNHVALINAGTGIHLPAYSSDSTTFLSGVGTWLTPAGGGDVYDSDILFTDITTGNADSDSHGFLLKLSMNTSNFLRADGTWQAPPAGGSIYDSDILFSDTTANNSTISQHGFLPKLSGDSDQYINGDGEWRTIVGGGSAPADAEYILSASDSDLASSVSIPGLAGSPDIAGAGGGVTSEEYDTATTGITFDAAVTTVNSDTQAKSHLYIKLTGDTSTHRGTLAYAPAGAFDIRAKISIGGTVTNVQSFGLWINDNASADDNGLLLWLSITPATPVYTLIAYTFASGTPTQRGATWTINAPIYLRFVRDGSNNVSFYFSNNGLAWQLINTVSFTFTPSRLGYRCALSNSGDVLEAYIDFLRTS